MNIEIQFLKREKSNYTFIRLKLKNNNHNINTSYGGINEELKKLNINNPTIKDISKVVCNIRRRKLPDPEQIGNAGSFFKNQL